MSGNEINMEDNKKRLVFNIIEGFCVDFSKTKDLPHIDIECSDVVDYISDLKDQQCTKECFIYKLIESNIDEADLFFLEGFIRGYSEIKPKDEISNTSYQDYLLKLKELRFRTLLEYKNILSHKLKKILIKLYKRYELIRKFKLELNKYMQDDREQDRYLYAKIAKKYKIDLHSDDVTEKFVYEKGLSEYFHAIYIANLLINKDNSTFLCHQIKDNEEVKTELNKIYTKYPALANKERHDSRMSHVLSTTKNEKIRQDARTVKDKYETLFANVPFSEKKDLIEKLYLLIKSNIETSDFFNELLKGNCSIDNETNEYKKTIDLDIKDYMPTIEALLTNQLDFSSPDEFLKNNIIGRYINKFTTLETIRNMMDEMENTKYQLEEETKYSHTDDETTIQGNKLENNKIVEETYKWKKFDRYLNPNHYRSIFNLKGRFKKKNDVKGGLEIKVLYKGNIFEGELWRGPTDNSDDIWKQSIDKDDYSFAVKSESGIFLFPKDTLVHIPNLSSRGGRTKRKRRSARSTRKNRKK